MANINLKARGKMYVIFENMYIIFLYLPYNI